MILPLLAKEEKAREGQLTLTAACIYRKGDNTKASPSLLSLPPMTAQPRHFPAVYGDTTYTKVFVGGLAWETQRDTLGAYFEQFGDILEAVVITDKHTGRSKGYGFVTFSDPESAMRACIDPSPVIDGRRANCNLASLGATQRTYPPNPHQVLSQFRHATTTATGSFAAVRESSAATQTAYFHPVASQYAYPYGFFGYNHEGVYVQSYYGGGQQQQLQSYYGGGQQQQQHFTPYYPAAAGQQGMLASQFTPYYPFYGQTSQAQPQAGPALHYTQLQQYGLYTAHNYAGAGILSLPAPPAGNAAAAAAGTAAVINAPSSSQQPRATAPEFKPST